jgi:hypothetical protein
MQCGLLFKEFHMGEIAARVEASELYSLNPELWI